MPKVSALIAAFLNVSNVLCLLSAWQVKKSRTALPLDEIEQEILIMRQIDHPHMVRLFEWYEDGNRIYLVLDYLKGGSLKDVIVQLNKKDQPVDGFHQIWDVHCFLMFFFPLNIFSYFQCLCLKRGFPHPFFPSFFWTFFLFWRTSEASKRPGFVKWLNRPQVVWRIVTIYDSFTRIWKMKTSCFWRNQWLGESWEVHQKAVWLPGLSFWTNRACEKF